jgi:hypothetical protein
MAPNGHASIQILQPMQRMDSILTSPSSFDNAMVGQIFTHGGSSHCIQVRETKKNWSKSRKFLIRALLLPNT